MYPRKNIDTPRPVNVIDLQMYRQHGYEFTETPRAHYGIDWANVVTWSVTLAWGVVFWLAVYLLALWLVA